MTDTPRQEERAELVTPLRELAERHRYAGDRRYEALTRAADLLEQDAEALERVRKLREDIRVRPNTYTLSMVEDGLDYLLGGDDGS